MKSQVILLTLGVVGVVLAAVPKHSTALPGQTDTENKQDEKILEKGFGEADKEPKLKNVEETIVADAVKSGGLEITIEETFNPSVIPLGGNDFDSVSDSADPYMDEVPETSFVDSNVYRGALDKVQGEIMETAAGFVPIPIFRRRRGPGARRRAGFAPRRRYFMRNPYRTPYYLYPYYGFYHPRSLRYY